MTLTDALRYHADVPPGKISLAPTKPLATLRDLSLAYTPGVAEPVLAIAKDPEDAYAYTSKGNLVAVISNGTAILGLGDRGALASKPVMEGKAVLFKRFAGVDAIDIEVDERDPHKLADIIAAIAPSFGGINLEDIKAPECFVVEEELRKRLDIPVFHDDQHGTAVVVGAALINAARIAGKELASLRVVVNGAGAAALAVTQFLTVLGVARERVILCDTKGVIYAGRSENMNPYKAAFAAQTSARSLPEAVDGADVFIGVSAAGALSSQSLATMAGNPIVFALANPLPEIGYDLAVQTRPDVIMATGRSDFPNQVNNLLGFPYIFRGALDARATAVNEAMKLAASLAIAELAREDVPREVLDVYGLTELSFGPGYILPKPFDPRLRQRVPQKVAEAAETSGIVRKR